MPLQHNYAEQLSELCTSVKPFPVSAPKVIALNQQLATELGFDTSILGQHLSSADFITPINADGLAHQLSNASSAHFASKQDTIGQALLHSLFSENGELQKCSVAQKYGGHQFGHWNPHLGDGRGLLLGELTDKHNQLTDLHLKGAGPTPYSRHADGRAVLRSTIREYLASEALHHLNIPTSRGLAMIATQEPVIREIREQGAMMIRTSPSHIRFGHFEYFFHSNEMRKLEALFEFCFEHHYSHLVNSKNKYLALLTEICTRTAELVANWQACGFNHGVMNTDNMSIHGITFDFGPYAFLDDFIANYICNKSDHEGRYAFDQQPSIALWNLNALAHAFSQKLSMAELKQALSQFEPRFLSKYQNLMACKLGLAESAIDSSQLGEQNSHNESPYRVKLATQFTKILGDEFADYHQSFRMLSNEVNNIAQGKFAFAEQFKQKHEMANWCQQYQQALNAQEHSLESIQAKMLATNPKYVLRNHLMQSAILAAQNDDFSVMHDLLNVICTPFEEHPEFTHLSVPPTEIEKGVALSCSS